MAQIFVSYARENSAEARHIVNTLTSAGYTVWWDDRLAPGAAFDAALEHELKEAQVVLALWSTHSVKSEWVRNEADYAWEKSKLVPLIIEQCDIPLAYRRLQSVDLTGWLRGRNAEAWDRVRTRLDELLNLPMVSPQSAAPARRRGTLIALLILGLLGVSGVVAGSFFLGGRSVVGCVAGLPDGKRLSARQQPPVLTSEDCLHLDFAAFRDCEDCPQMVVIPAGAVEVGAIAPNPASVAVGPTRTAQIARRFAVSRFEVTWGDWARCVAAGACAEIGSAGTDRTANLPIHSLTWIEAETYVTWLARDTGKRYRMLSESEWERAARAGGTTLFYGSTAGGSLCRFENVLDRSAFRRFGQALNSEARIFPCDDGHAFVSAVGSFRSNAFGLFDANGNVGEMVADCYTRDFAQAPADGSPIVTDTCGTRLARGGSWFSGQSFATGTYRRAFDIDERSDLVGLRLARDID